MEALKELVEWDERHDRHMKTTPEQRKELSDKFKIPVGYGGDDWGFYRRGAQYVLEFVLPFAVILSENRRFERGRYWLDIASKMVTTKLDIAEDGSVSDEALSIRIGMIEQMSKVVMDKIFKGQFPAYSYMYSIRPFMRIKGIEKEEIDEFVSLASGKSLSTRDVDLLARGYFNGNEDFREQLKNGDISWVLGHLKEKETAGTTGATSDCTELERRVLREFENFRYTMSKIIHYSSDNRLKSPSFLALAHTWVGKIIKQMAGFTRCLEDFHDRTRQT